LIGPSDEFERSLPLIERLLAGVCRRNSFPPDESEEFASWAKLRLIEDDYAVIRKFKGRSALSTYLATVVVNLFRDYRTHLWGKWRPSAEAKRLGPVAVQLETLVSRDGHSVPEAIAHMQVSLKVSRSSAELEALAERLPSRARRRIGGEELLVEVSAPDHSESRLDESALRVTERSAQIALARGLASLAPVERLTLKLRYADGLPAVDIARMLGEPPRIVYGRIERSLSSIRRSMEGEGLDAKSVVELIGWHGFDLNVDYGLSGEDRSPSPSSSMERSVG
jgi:RNA polymerase sigma factor for flagellar operon FliA